MTTQSQSSASKSELIRSLNDYYDKHRLSAEHAQYEPNWRPCPFDQLDEMSDASLKEMVRSIGKTDMNARDSIFGPRPTQDMWKIGTATWVFMGRKEAVIQGLFKVCPTDPTLVASGRVMPKGFKRVGKTDAGPLVLWALWRTDDDGFTLGDRNPGFEDEIDEIFARRPMRSSSRLLAKLFGAPRNGSWWRNRPSLESPLEARPTQPDCDLLPVIRLNGC